MLKIMFVVVAIETAALHIGLMLLWSEIAAWIATGLSVYSVFWLIGDYRALERVRSEIGEDSFSLRMGKRWRAEIAREDVREVARLGGALAARPKEVLRLVAFGLPTVRLVLEEPVEFVGMYGIKRRASEVWLGVDDPDRFCELLRDERAA
ncbi:MAG: hypothetical protein ACYTF7_08070 [Planctomycetota bacterium]